MFGDFCCNAEVTACGFVASYTSPKDEGQFTMRRRWSVPGSIWPPRGREWEARFHPPRGFLRSSPVHSGLTFAIDGPLRNYEIIQYAMAARIAPQATVVTQANRISPTLRQFACRVVAPIPNSDPT